jgi:UDP-N-acetylglucosamine--N-acetylmuramyl-(pentapeptide) pyrophosphoryl-undecaprenol N-acetylglucosamine transferase
MSLPVFMLAGGGTGGHVFPMVAVADALRAEAQVRVVYIGTSRGIETRVVPERGDELEVLEVLPIKGGGAMGAIRGVARAAAVLPRARALVQRLAPSALLAVGGYAAGPVGLAAWSARVPVAILAPDVVLGLANRWLVPFAKRAYVAFPETEQRLGSKIARRTGVPLRGSFRPSLYAPVPGRMQLLVLGGSQGAKALNEVVPAAFAEASRKVSGLSIVHQAGRDRDAEVRARYEELGVGAQATVRPFVDDVAGELARTDLFIGRSGAGALAELCAVGRASILVPLPAKRVHQTENAEALAKLGGAICVPQGEASVERLTREIVAVAEDEKRRVAMAGAAQAQGRPDAAREIARDLLVMAGILPASTTSPSPSPSTTTTTTTATSTSTSTSKLVAEVGNV